MSQPVDIDDPDYLQKAKWVRIMCDFSADGVWDRQGRAEDCDSLPVSEHLKEMIKGWQEWHEFSDDEMGNPDYQYFWDVKAFSVMGLCIARKVKTELPDWTVVYFDMEKAETTKYDRDNKSIEYEYEIIMPPRQKNQQRE